MAETRFNKEYLPRVWKEKMRAERILVSGVPTDFHLEAIQSYFENKKRSSGGPIKGKPERIQDSEEVIITFESEKDAENVVQRKVHNISRCKLHVDWYKNLVWQEDAMIVSNGPKDISEKTLIDFLEKTGKLDIVYVSSGRKPGTFLVYCQSEIVVLDVCTRDHILQNVKLDVQPFWEPLEENTISRQQVHDYLLPSQFHLTFLQKHKIIVNDQLKKWAEVIWKDSKFNKLKLKYSEGNLKQIEQCLKELLNSITIETIDVPTDMFEDIVRTFNSEADQRYFYFDNRNFQAHILGFNKSNVIKMKNRLLDTFRRKCEFNLNIHERRILSGHRFFEQAERQFEGLQVRIHGNKVVFEGQYSKVANCQNSMYKILQSMVKSELCLPLNTGMIINKKPVKEYLDGKLRNKKCIGSWEMGDGDSVILYASDKTHLSLLEEIMKQTFVANTLNFIDKIKDTPNYGKWLTLVKSVKAEFPDFHFIGENSIVAVDAVVNDIKNKIDNFEQSLTYESYISINLAHFLFLKEFKDQEINDFGAKNKIKNVCLKDNKLHLEGTQNQIRKMETFIENLRKDTSSKEVKLEMFRFREFLQSEEGNTFLCEMQKKSESIISLNSDLGSETDGILNFVYKNCEIVLKEGDITTLDTDAIVNAANGKLDHKGGIAAAIVQKGGFEIQIESNKIMNRRRSELKTGEVVSTKAGKLKCKTIIHAVGPVWNNGRTHEIFYLSRAVQNCLAFLEEKSYTSIAIPAISTGTLVAESDVKFN
ncbi:protein mono-ADP-ribosyltransferase PARP14-like [Octopus vulgaris]|uniref:Protein mono-ADP-ribosyltransferase PARP14-like n=1 Tax=Octopus vulgaris TaxID=6645 RepID=A0AA36EWC7_OCTVU|nr:protein mono-ADP-ribosyltransferase PARP14-like [Octopus vulgaris]